MPTSDPELTETIQRKFKWQPHYTKVLVMVQQGRANAFIAQSLNMSTRNIEKIRARPEFVERMDDVQTRIEGRTVEKLAEENVRDKTRKIIDEGSYAAVKRMKAILMRRPPYNKMSVAERRLLVDTAKDFLDRANFKGIDVTEIRERTYSDEELLSMEHSMQRILDKMERLEEPSRRFLLTRPEKTDEVEPSVGGTDTDENPQRIQTRPETSPT